MIWSCGATNFAVVFGTTVLNPKEVYLIRFAHRVRSRETTPPKEISDSLRQVVRQLIVDGGDLFSHELRTLLLPQHEVLARVNTAVCSFFDWAEHTKMFLLVQAPRDAAPAGFVPKQTLTLRLDKGRAACFHFVGDDDSADGPPLRGVQHKRVRLTSTERQTDTEDTAAAAAAAADNDLLWYQWPTAVTGFALSGSS